MAPEPTFEADYTFAREEPFRLDGGGTLRPVTVRYAVYGEPRPDNVILVCHALSGSARAAEWWPEMFDGAFDTRRYCVIGTNVIGSCYGSTGPCSPDPSTGELYRASFPLVTVRDMVRAQAHLLDHLGVGQLRAVVGGSIGGMQALQWAVDYPERVGRCVAVGAAPLSAMGLALNHLQRAAIRNDPRWREGNYAADEQPAAGLALARAIAMCSYKSAALFAERFARRPNRNGEDPHRSVAERFDVAGYLDHQGAIFVRRFDANAYVILTKAMDTFDLARGYESEAHALARVRARTLLVGITSDWLFPPSDVRALAERMGAAGARARYIELESAHGHDGFLADAAALAPVVESFLSEERVSETAGAASLS